MTQVHIHLLITHLPVFASLIGILILIYAMLIKSDQTKMAAYYVFILSAIGAGIAYVTGEGAEEAVENITGVVESTISAHEDFAIYALISLIVIGLLSILATFITYNKMAISNLMATIVLFSAIIGFGLIAKTASLGGQIRHTEITAKNTANGSVIESDGKSEEDDD